MPEKPLPKPAMQALSEDLELHLRNPFMAGKPHIGVLGTEPSTSPSKGEDTELQIDASDNAWSGESQDSGLDPDWRFVPHKAVCAATITPTGKPVSSHVRFAIRVKEGCEEDLAPSEDRAEDGQLVLKDILSAIRYYDVRITSAGPGREASFEVLRDGKVVEKPRADTSETQGHQTASVEIEDQSDWFLTFSSGEEQMVRQSYRIVVTQTIQDAGDGTWKVELRVVNASPFSTFSRLPFYGRDTSNARNDKKDVRKDEYLARIRAGNPALPPGFDFPLWRDHNRASNPNGNSYGFVMDFQASLTLSSKTPPFTEKDAGRTINVIAHWEPTNATDGTLRFRDSAVFKERIPKMAAGSAPGKFLARLGLDEDLVQVFAKDMGWETMHIFQEAGVRAIHGAITKQEHDVVVISARTAGGKTEAFGIPAINRCLARGEEPGTKAIIFYPTKALSNDQANRFIEILYHLNQRLEAGGRRPLTMGIVHGDISRGDPKDEAEMTELPLACCRRIEGNPCPGRISPLSHTQSRCDSCRHEYGYIRIFSRQSSYSDPPDILITNPDTMTWDLQVRPQNHGVLGRPVQACRNCRATYASRGTKRKCSACQREGEMDKVHGCVPDLVVFDEVHLVKGAFGINTSLFLSRLQAVLAEYARRYHDSPKHRTVLVGSTATISNPETFAREFFNATPDRIAIVPRTDDERRTFYADEDDQDQHRYHLAMLPYAYQGDSTVGRAVRYVETRAVRGDAPARITPAGTLEQQRAPMAGPLQVLGFVNNIRTSNSLIGIAQRDIGAEGLAGVVIGGHTTDFDQDQRADTERKFNRSELHVLFATSTLEVGVDFRRVDCVVVYGMPFSFNDYLQRIGRTGRRADGLVLTVCQNWQPVDHYYFANLRTQISNPMMAMEPVPITRSNVEAHKRNAKAAMLDWLASRENSDAWSENVKALPVGPGKAGGLEELEKYALGVLETPPKYQPEVKNEIRMFYGELLNNAVGRLQAQRLMEFFMDQVNLKHQVTNLRSTDPQVNIEINW